jgi:hypothetical protein
MSEASYLTELRETAPPAPERLRDVVRALPETHIRTLFRLRPALAAAFAIAFAVGLGAAIIGGLSGNREREQLSADAASVHTARAFKLLAPHAPKYSPWGAATGKTVILAPSLTATSRLQRQDVFMSLRVKDLSGATQSAVRTARRLGGFVAGADYSTSSNSGNSRLALRIPVTNLQKAIASFTELGTILSQHISVADLQGGLDKLDVRIAAKQKKIGTLTGQQLEREKRALARLERSRAALIREGTYARVSLQLTTAKPAAKHLAPTRFDRFRDNAGDILGKELIAVLYALVVAGPFIILAAIALIAERARRRRADHRLLEETG